MLILKILNFFEGSDTVKIEPSCDSEGEAALDILMESGIAFDGVHRDSEGRICFRISHRNSSETVSILDKNGIKVYSICMHGFPSLWSRYKRRPGIAVGLVLFMLTIWFSTKIIWNIEVVGGTETDEEAVIERLSGLGCSVGSFIPGIDFYGLCTDYLAKYSDTAWISVNILGNTAEVRLLESREKNIQTDRSKPANIVASTDGLIEYVNTFSGASVVSDGDTVVKGQLLISGVVENKNDFSNRYVRADGCVMARTYHEISVDIPMVYEKRIYDASPVKKTSMSIFGAELPFGGGDIDVSEAVETESVKDRLCIFGDIVLPITQYTTIYYPYHTEATERTREEADMLAQAEMAARITEQLGGADIISRETEVIVSQSDSGTDVYTMICRIRCIENIAEPVPMTVIK